MGSSVGDRDVAPFLRSVFQTLLKESQKIRREVEKGQDRDQGPCSGGKAGG